jgi:hypothetical protein
MSSRHLLIVAAPAATVSGGRGCEAQRALLFPTRVWPRQDRGGKGVGSRFCKGISPRAQYRGDDLGVSLAPKNQYLDQTQCPEFANAVYNAFQFLNVLHARVALFRRAEVLRARKFSLGGT